MSWSILLVTCLKTRSLWFLPVLNLTNIYQDNSFSKKVIKNHWKLSSKLKYPKLYPNFKDLLAALKMDLIWAAHECVLGGRGAKEVFISKICHRYPTIMKLGTAVLTYRRSKKYITHVTWYLSFANIRIFAPEISNFC